MNSNDKVKIKGFYTFKCYDKDGKLKWKDRSKNTVVTVGKNELLDNGLDGSNGYMGLISSVDYSTIAAGDIMTSHAGWKEANSSNAPDYTGDRKACVWASGGSGAKALSAALSFVFSGGGTVKGAFIVFGASASATKADTGGVLFSAGLFSGGDRVVAGSDTLNVSYTATLT
jgi:hypothetical protein